MKKFITMLLACLFLVGCESKSTEFDMDKAISTIESKLSNMEVIAEGTLKDAYGLDLSSAEKYVFKQNKNGDFYAIIKTTSKSNTKENMDKYFEKVKDFNSSYSPERLKLLNDRLEKEVGNYLIYIIAKDADDIYQNILDNLD